MVGISPWLNDSPDVFARWYADELSKFAGKQVFFLDRDGVLIEETNYLCRREDVLFTKDAEFGILKLNKAEIPVVIVTNQSGIGRGYYSWTDFLEVQEYIYDSLAKIGAHIDACVACAYHPQDENPAPHSGYFFRKPNPGMLFWTAKTAGLDLRHSWLVGDKLSDLQAGERAGVERLGHVMTGHGKLHRQIIREWSTKGNLAVRYYEDMYEAVEDVLRTI